MGAVADGGASVLVLDRKALGIQASRVPGLAKVLRRLYRDRILQQLVPPDSCLSALEVDERHKLSAAFRSKVYATGDVVLTQGQRAAGFFVVVAGSAEVTRTHTDGSTEHLARLELGDVFGEISLIEDVPVMATVRAVTPLTCFALGRGVFRQTMAELPDQLAQVTMIARQRMARAVMGPDSRPDARAEVVQLARNVVVGSMTCPACGFDQPFSLLCTACGADVLEERTQLLPELVAGSSFDLSG